MLDTDTCIYARKQPAGFTPRLPLHECGISIIVLGELEWAWHGRAASRRTGPALRALVAAVQVIDLDADVRT